MANINLGYIKGDAGLGVPAGGTTGQFLNKDSNTNYDTSWVNPPVGEFDPFRKEEIKITSNSTTNGKYTDVEGNEITMSGSTDTSGFIYYLPNNLLDDGKIHQIRIKLDRPNGTGTDLKLRYNGTIAVRISRFYYVYNYSATVKADFMADVNNAYLTPTANIISLNSFSKNYGYIWIQKI